MSKRSNTKTTDSTVQHLRKPSKPNIQEKPPTLLKMSRWHPPQEVILNQTLKVLDFVQETMPTLSN